MLFAATSPPRLVTLILLTGVSVLSLNMFLPSLTNMAADFQAVLAVVGQRDRFLEAIDLADRRDGPEALLVENVHVRRAVDQDGRLDEPTAVEFAPAAAAGHGAGTLVAGVLHERLVAVPLLG